jgi:TRAP-type C4-dicarboxylate transport system substrate-binding protein
MSGRIISCTAAVAAATLGVTGVGCGGDSATDKAGGSGNPVTLRLATPDRQGLPGTQAIERFGEEVAKLSDGAIRIKPVYEAAGDAPRFDQAVADLVRTGRADLALIPARAWDEYGVTSLNALQAPFLIRNHAVLEEVVSGELAKPMLEGLQRADVTGLALLPENLRHPFGFARPLLSPRDFAGATIRAPRSEATYDLLRKLGAEPVDLAGEEFAQALENGTVTGAESAFDIAASTLHEFGTGTSNITFFPKVNVLVANSQALDRLTDEQRATLDTAAERTRDWVLESMPSEQDAAQAYCREGGRVIAAKPADVRALEAAAQPRYAQLERDPQTRDIIAQIRAVAQHATNAPTEDAPTCGPSRDDTGASAAGSGSGIPNGVYRNEITIEEMVAAGVNDATARDNAGIHTIKLTDGELRETPSSDAIGTGPSCDATYSVTGDSFTFKWTTTDCVGNFTATWSLSNDELRLSDVRCADSQCGLVDRVLWGLKPFRKIG